MSWEDMCMFQGLKLIIWLMCLEKKPQIRYTYVNWNIEDSRQNSNFVCIDIPQNITAQNIWQGPELQVLKTVLKFCRKLNVSEINLFPLTINMVVLYVTQNLLL